MLRTMKAKKIRNRLLSAAALILALMVAAAGCAGNSAGQTNGTQGGAAATGGYLEEKMDVSAYSALTTLASDADGAVWAAGKRADTEKWELICWADVHGAGKTVPIDIEGTPSCISVSPDGTIALLASLGGGALPGGAISFQGDQDSSAPDGSAPDGSAPDGSAPDGEQQESPQGGENRGANRGGANIISGFGGQSVVYWLDKDGAVIKETQLPEASFSPSIIALDGYELILSSAMDGVVRCDADGQSVLSYFSGYASAAAVGGGKLYVLDAMSNKLVEYDLATGKQTAEMTDLPDASGANLLPDGAVVHIVCPSGIWVADMSANTVTQSLDSVNYSMNDPDLSIAGACLAKDGTVVVSLSQGAGGMMFVGGAMMVTMDGGSAATDLYAYLWSPDIDFNSMRTLTITALWDSQMLRKAISEFQRLHPDVFIKLNTYLDANDTQTPVTDYIRTINAELLAGKGADVLILDGLPIDNYIKKGVLADLSGMLDDIGLLPGIKQGSADSDGKTYGLPALFSFNTVWANKDVLDGINSLYDMAAIASGLPDGKTALAPRTSQDLIELFFEANRSQFTDDDGVMRFDTPEFEEFLELIYELYAPIEETENEFTGMRVMAAGRTAINMSDMLEMANDTIALLPLNITGVTQVDTAYSAAGAQDSAWMGIPDLSGDSLSYTPSLIAGINAQSQNPDLAEDFVRLIFSDEVQSSAGFAGLPTTTLGLDKLFADARENERFTTMSIAGGAQISFQSADDATWTALRDYCDRVNRPSAPDSTLMGFIYEETAKFFDGSRSAKDTAYAVQQRVAAYLAE